LQGAVQTFHEKKCGFVPLTEEDYFFFFAAGFLVAAAFFAGFLAAAFFAAAIGIHLLPERVIIFLNLRINKYFGRNGFFGRRNPQNHHFFGRKLTPFCEIPRKKAFHHEMRNPL